jgi:imidazolonepropionase-like amidohydrolase
MPLRLALQLLAITHATIIDPASGTVRPDMTVVVTGNRVTQLGKAAQISVPAGSRTVDGRGKFIIPGLWDMHVHTDVPGGRHLLALYVANGVTGIRDMDGSLTTLRGWQRAISRGELDGPRMVVSGPYLVGQRTPTPHLLVRSAADAATAVDSLIALGVDFVKVHNGMTPEAYFAVAREARRRRIVFAGHVFPPVTPRQASDSGQRSLEHLSGFPNYCTSADSAVTARALPLQRFLFGGCTSVPQNELYTHLAKNGTWVTPTMLVQTEVADLGQAPAPNDTTGRFISDSLRTLWRMVMPLPPNPPTAAVDAGRRLYRMRVAMVGALHNAGVHLLAGTDAPLRPSPPGFGLHDELALFVRAGLTPLQALRTATSEPASYLSATDSLGSIEVGKVADLVVLDADPLQDIGNTRRVHAVLANGKLYDEAGRRALFERAERAARQ